MLLLTRRSARVTRVPSSRLRHDEEVTTTTSARVPAPQVGAAERRTPEARSTATLQEAARPRPRGVVRGLFRLVADVVRKSDRDRMLGLAGENAFMAVLTTFPIAIVAAAVLGQLSLVIGTDNARRVEESVLASLQDLLTDSAGPAIDTARSLFETSGNTLTVALVLALGSLAQAFASIINTVTLAYDVRDTRGWWKRRWYGLLIGLGSVLMAVVVITLVVVGPLFAAGDVVRSVGLDREYAWLWANLRAPVAFGALVLWATTMFHVCPDRAGPWRSGLPGGLLTAVLCLGASVGFNFYLDVALGASPVFGALGGGLILMTWLYLLCFGVLAGAELNAVLLARRSVRLGLDPEVKGRARRRLLRGRGPVEQPVPAQQPNPAQQPAP